MGDVQHQSRPQAMDSATGFARDGSQGISASSPSPYKFLDNTTPFYSQLSSIPNNQLRLDHRNSVHSSAQFAPQDHGPTSMNMTSMAGALPEFNTVDDASVPPPGPQSIPRTLPGASPSSAAYHFGQNIQLPGPGSGYAMAPYQQQAFGQGSQHSAYHPFAPNQPRIPGGSSMQTAFQNYAQHPQYMYYSAPYGQYQPVFSGHAGQNQTTYERRGSMAGTAAGVISPQAMDFQRDQAVIGSAFGAPFARAQGIPQSGPVSSIPRGPPRKPKQSGHALWVGNLPSGTTVVALKDHFSREATKDIESLFLISKSNCAFVNYRSEASCTDAMHRFHDSRFNGVRLVCRLRRSSAPASGVPTGPSAMVGSQHFNSSPPKTPKADAESTDQLQDGIPGSPIHKGVNEAPETSTSPNKYFIVKSLTLQDLELSVRNGIWATQSHNEDVLNKAFRTTENVYLIFSANKSGEYFGYARMTSPILEDGSRLVDPAPKPESIVDAHDVPKSIPTPATEWAPRGKIIDDSARGTIFWEAELSDAEVEEEAPKKDEKVVDGDNAPVAQSWGKPFKIEWVSTNRLPFYRTRGLRNPWNANREVKIARDGTELEPSVGERLIAMFHRVPSNPGAPMMPLHPQMAGPVMPHHMRTF